MTELKFPALALALLVNWAGHIPAQEISLEEARGIAKDAYIYGFPLVDNYRIQHSYFVDQAGAEYKGGWNEIHSEANVFTPHDKAIQTPNSDTPYSFLGADLRAEPLVISVPAVDPKRYYSAQLIDQYTFNFAYIGSRATGSEAGNYLLAGPGWQEEKPDGIKDVIRCETQFAFVLFRTQLFGPEDLDEVKKVQAGYRVQPLSQFLGRPALSAPKIEFPKPLSVEEQRKSPEFFTELNFILQFCPPNPAEKELLARFAKLGIGGKGTYDPAKLSPELRQAVVGGTADALKEFQEFKTSMIDTGKTSSADGFGTREFLGGDYMRRMSSAVLGIYGNSKEEALYPAYFVDADSEKLDGNHRYTLHFPADQLPPVHSFWSLTLYELPSSLLYANPIKRYLINSPMTESLKKDADGGITLHIQHEPPAKELESNWLPAPKGPFFCVIRLYWPKEEALDGTWKNPLMKKVDAATGVPVTVENFNRAESDLYFAGTVKIGGFGKFTHYRDVTPLNAQTVIRMNRDTLYSAGVFDLDAGPVTITVPDSGGRFLSMQIINEDHYTQDVIYTPGKYIFTRDKIGTRYFIAAVRVLIDPAKPGDAEIVHALQDGLKVDQPGGPGKFEIPAWDQASQKKVRDALLVLGSTLPDTNHAFGSKESVDPVRFIIGSALGWGGNPEKEAIYINVTPAQNDGKTIHRLTVQEVPVDGFWSISLYNAEGYFQENQQNAYTVNNLTARKNADGTTTVQFGGEPGSAPNVLPIMPGWNYMVRLYRPHAEILKGTWEFPKAVPDQEPR